VALVEKPTISECDLCDRNFDNLRGLKIHKGKQHGQNVSPIPQLDGTDCETVEYEFSLETHEACTDDDIVEALKTNFHCPLDDEKVDRNDPIRYFKVQKTNQKLDLNGTFQVFL
jgi:hypothetical protein